MSGRAAAVASPQNAFQKRQRNAEREGDYAKRLMDVPGLPSLSEKERGEREGGGGQRRAGRPTIQTPKHADPDGGPNELHLSIRRRRRRLWVKAETPQRRLQGPRPGQAPLHSEIPQLPLTSSLPSWSSVVAAVFNGAAFNPQFVSLGFLTEVPNSG